jgi:uncharacterized membrane protein YgdD (TMEM256/DUF423 family)
MKIWLFIAAINGAVAVLCGAFAAHGLKARLSADMVGVFDTGARYHLTHALALGLAALSPARGAAAARARLSAILFLAGIILFCGSLYLLALTGQTGFGWITPFGGLALVGGWVTLAAAALKMETP